MKFGEKVKKLRMEKKMTADELAQQLGVSVRTIYAYESGNTYPRNFSFYDDLAKVLGVTADYLRTENEEFMTEVGEQYGTRAQRQYNKAIAEAKKLFAGGDLAEEDELAFVMEVQQLFLDSKKRAKKFTPKKYRLHLSNPKD